MAKVLTIRDPKTGALIAEEWLRPDEEKDSALVRVFRKTLGPNAPEPMVLTRSIWLDDQKWAAELAKDWGSFDLVLLGPKGDARLEKSHLVLARVSEREPSPHLEFPLEKRELNAIRQGRRRDVVVPASPEDPPAVGDRVRFVQAGYDPFGELLLVENGDSVLVELTKVRNLGEKWGSRDLYSIAWDPPQARKSSKEAAAHGPR
jgi:hypothetical protein